VDRARRRQHGPGAMHLPVADDVRALGHCVPVDFQVIVAPMVGGDAEGRSSARGALPKPALQGRGKAGSAVAATPHAGYSAGSNSPGPAPSTGPFVAPLSRKCPRLLMIQLFRKSFSSKFGVGI